MPGRSRLGLLETERGGNRIQETERTRHVRDFDGLGLEFVAKGGHKVLFVYLLGHGGVCAGGRRWFLSRKGRTERAG